jgi:hypothetical protein
LILEASIGAGLVSNSVNTGNVITAGFGARLPIGDHWLAGATYSLTRQHQNGETESQYLNSNSPVIYSGPDVHNTLIGRLEYGLSYRF